MRILAAICASLATLATPAWSETAARCPHSDGDACGEWEFERLDKELAEMVAGPSGWIDAMPAQLRDAARTALVEAQTQWMAFRDVECRRQLTWSYMTARTSRGFVANCLVNLTFHRRNALQEAYRFKPR